MCKRSRMKRAYTYGHEPVIHASVGARNAWEITAFRHTISSQTQRQTDGSMVIDEYRARTTLYSCAPTVTESVPGDGKRGVTRSLYNGKLCIVLDGELPIP